MQRRVNHRPTLKNVSVLKVKVMFNSVSEGPFVSARLAHLQEFVRIRAEGQPLN